MKRRLLILSTGLLVLLLLLIRAAPQFTAHGQITNFIIDNADATNTLTMTGSSGLLPIIQNVADRIILQYANASHYLDLIRPPDGMITLLQSVQDRIVLQYANASQYFHLTPLPAALTSLIQAVEDRFVLQYANASNTLPLGYPVELIGDTTPPAVTSISSSPSGGSLVVSVTTAEYTTAEIQYGLTSGSYPYSQVNDLFQYTHEFVLPGLDSGEVYYYSLVLTDRSDNVTYTPEATLEPLLSIYLPALVHH